MQENAGLGVVWSLSPLSSVVPICSASSLHPPRLSYNNDIHMDTSIPSKNVFVNGFKAEVGKALKTQYEDWDGIGTTFNLLRPYVLI